MTYLQAIIIAIVEGITEFLPISSTGHMALTASFLGIEKATFTKLFIENIQFGTIISVIVLYWKKFVDFKHISFYLKLFFAFIPAAFIGILLKKHIDQVLESPLFITIIMFIGGVILLFVDKWFNKPKLQSESELSYKSAFIIGCFQVLSILFPGLSRSAATIVGGMQQKLTRQAAAEFSFFLAVPTLAGAFAKSLWDTMKNSPEILTKANVNLLIMGNVIGFIVAMFAIKLFIGFLTKYGFRLFGWYRIVVGLVIISLILFGYKLSVV